MPNYGQGAEGAAGGALTGAAVGSIVPGIGTAIGAGVGGIAGGLAGLFSNKGKENPNEMQNRQMLMDYYNSVQNRGAPQAGPAAQAGYSGFRSNQSDLISRLEAQSRGQGPSLATEQMKMATDRGQAQQSAFANSGRGGPLAAQQAANNQGMLGANAGQMAMQGRIQEQASAQQQLGMQIYSGRNSDEQTNQFNANEQNQQSLANLDARLKAMNIDDTTRMQILQQLAGQNAAVAGRPGVGDQLLSGGAGAFSFAAGQGAFKPKPPGA